jgi:hypothetical protein
MARLIYSAIMSLDGYIADAEGNFDWAAPDEEVHAFVNDLERPVSTYLYRRRMYETMRYWETAHTVAGRLPVSLDFAQIWVVPLWCQATARAIGASVRAIGGPSRVTWVSVRR